MVKKAKNKVTTICDNIVVEKHETKEQHYYLVKYFNQIKEKIDEMDVKIIRALLYDATQNKQTKSKNINEIIAKILAIIEFERKLAEKPEVNRMLMYQAIADILASGIQPKEVINQFLLIMPWKQIREILSAPKIDLKEVSNIPKAVELFQKYSK